MVYYYPLGQRIVGVLKKTPKEVKVGSIILAPNTNDGERYDEITITEVGRGYISQSGNVVPMQSKVGDVVLVNKGGSLPLPKIGDASFDEENEYVAFQESDIIVKKSETKLPSSNAIQANELLKG